MSAIKGSKNDSGAEKRKRKKAQEERLESQKGSIFKYLKQDDLAVIDDAEATQMEEKTESMEIGQMIALDHIPNISSNLTSTKEQEPVEDNEIEITAKEEIESFQDDNIETVDWSDIGCWPINIENSQQRDFLKKNKNKKTKISFSSKSLTLIYHISYIGRVANTIDVALPRAAKCLEPGLRGTLGSLWRLHEKI
ncbi:hypothetical protein HELRODRAFT_180446 [Helobdella robusta]|uniref:Uncharacterized protein n=1 Tax=Helobdella robusta TaxID=6412 RepID=T1FFX4_HELRO|nr:hypothetical protein HELRODRAFT_180446 [Helobdella robusta]ESN94019.1 hypothetical protein HELRODRAFT_180446 [Helobdella robusta]